MKRQEKPIHLSYFQANSTSSAIAEYLIILRDRNLPSDMLRIKKLETLLKNINIELANEKSRKKTNPSVKRG